MTERNRTWLEVVIAATLGLAVIVVPVALDPNARQYDTVFIPAVRNGVEGLTYSSILLLVVIGVLVGYFGKGPVWIVGPAVLAFFPLWSVIDMLMGGKHHLFPIEWFFYALESLLGLIGAGIGRAIKKSIG